jgi:hypothetical protein
MKRSYVQVSIEISERRGRRIRAHTSREAGCISENLVACLTSVDDDPLDTLALSAWMIDDQIEEPMNRYDQAVSDARKTFRAAAEALVLAGVNHRQHPEDVEAADALAQEGLDFFTDREAEQPPEALPY